MRKQDTIMSHIEEITTDTVKVFYPSNSYTSPSQGLDHLLNVISEQKENLTSVESVRFGYGTVMKVTYRDEQRSRNLYTLVLHGGYFDCLFPMVFYPLRTWVLKQLFKYNARKDKNKYLLIKIDSGLSDEDLTLYLASYGNEAMDNEGREALLTLLEYPLVQSELLDMLNELNRLAGIKRYYIFNGG